MSFGVEFGLNTIGKMIEENKKRLNGHFVAGVVGNKDSLEQDRCLIITSGLYGKINGGFKREDRILTRSRLDKLGLVYYLAFYLELQVDNKDKILSLNPLYLSYAASSAKRNGSGRKHVTVAVALSDNALIDTNGIKEDKAFSVFRYDFGRLEIGQSYSQDLLKGIGASQPKMGKHDQAAFNISAVVTESEDPSIALSALSEAFDSKKSDLQSALEEALRNALSVNGKK